MTVPYRDTKIVAILGPASNDNAAILELAKSGVDVFRLNMSHGAQDAVAKMHAAIRQAESTLFYAVRGSRAAYGARKTIQTYSCYDTSGRYCPPFVPRVGTAKRCCPPGRTVQGRDDGYVCAMPQVRSGDDGPRNCHHRGRPNRGNRHHQHFACF